MRDFYYWVHSVNLVHYSVPLLRDWRMDDRQYKQLGHSREFSSFSFQHEGMLIIKVQKQKLVIINLMNEDQRHKNMEKKNRLVKSWTELYCLGIGVFKGNALGALHSGFAPLPPAGRGMQKNYFYISSDRKNFFQAPRLGPGARTPFSKSWRRPCVSNHEYCAISHLTTDSCVHLILLLTDKKCSHFQSIAKIFSDEKHCIEKS